MGSSEVVKHHLIFIHGAGATTRSFNYVREHLPDHDASFVTHHHDEALFDIIERTTQIIEKAGCDVVLVGHSLGGIIAFGAHHNPRVTKMITICAPFGGSQAAELFRWVSSSKMFDNIRPQGRILRTIRAMPLRVPHLAFVGIHGLPLSREPNDGVVTVASQTCLQGPVYQQIDVNHSETLMDEGVTNMMAKFLWGSA